MNKKEIVSMILIVWLLGTTGYMIRDIWNDYKIQGIQRAYESAVLQIVNESEKSNCQPFTVFAGEKKVQLVDVKCVSDQQPESENKDKSAENMQAK